MRPSVAPRRHLLCRELRVKMVKTDALGALLSSLTKRKLPVESFVLSLEKASL